MVRDPRPSTCQPTVGATPHKTRAARRAPHTAVQILRFTRSRLVHGAGCAFRVQAHPRKAGPWASLQLAPLRRVLRSVQSLISGLVVVLYLYLYLCNSPPTSPSPSTSPSTSPSNFGLRTSNIEARGAQSISKSEARGQFDGAGARRRRESNLKASAHSHPQVRISIICAQHQVSSAHTDDVS